MLVVRLAEGGRAEVEAGEDVVARLEPGRQAHCRQLSRDGERALLLACALPGTLRLDVGSAAARGRRGGWADPRGLEGRVGRSGRAPAESRVGLRHRSAVAGAPEAGGDEATARGGGEPRSSAPSDEPVAESFSFSSALRLSLCARCPVHRALQSGPLDLAPAPQEAYSSPRPSRRSCAPHLAPRPPSRRQRQPVLVLNQLGSDLSSSAGWSARSCLPSPLAQPSPPRSSRPPPLAAR